MEWAENNQKKYRILQYQKCIEQNKGEKGKGHSSVQLLSHVQLFVTPWTAACQASLSITDSWSLLKLMSTESVIPSNHLILSSSSLAFSLSQQQAFFQWVSSSHQVTKVLELSALRVVSGTVVLGKWGVARWEWV